jgi:16S rRNA processing protein RimM
LISVGKILRSQGERGELRLKFYGDDLVEPAGLRAIFVGKEGTAKEYRIESLVPRGKTYDIKLAGVDSLSQANRLAGLEVFVREEGLKEGREGQFYLFQVAGCSVLGPEGEVIGTVIDVLSVPGNDLLVVRGKGKEILIPFNQSICKKVDITRKEIRIDPPAGLLDVDEI